MAAPAKRRRVEGGAAGLKAAVTEALGKRLGKGGGANEGRVAYGASPHPDLGAKLTLSLPKGVAPGGCAVELYLFGAHVVRWRARGRERLWMSSLSAMDGSAPIRGGIPIAFPQFADQGPMPLHGFARTQKWTVTRTSVGAEFATAELRLRTQGGGGDPAVCVPDAAWLPPADPPRALELKYTVTLRPEALWLRLEARNSGERAWAFTGCLHTYLRFADSRRLTLRGLKGCSYRDKVRGDAGCGRVEEEETLRLEDASKSSGGFVDRVYKRLNQVYRPRPLTLVDEKAGERYELSQHGAFHDTVVFNPWEEGKKGDKGPDFDDDGYKYMLCVEPAVASAPLEVPAGGSWWGMQKIRICSDGKKKKKKKKKEAKKGKKAKKAKKTKKAKNVRKAGVGAKAAGGMKKRRVSR